MAPAKKNKTKDDSSIFKSLQMQVYKLLQFIQSLLFEYDYFWLVALGLFVAEVVINIGIIWNVRYTEIDWGAYMDEVEGFLNGTFDYTKLQGGTGPLVYPAGFVYIFSGFYYLTDHGKDIILAQHLFFVLYLGFLACVFVIYYTSKKTPPYAMFFICCASYRIHSIFVLRLFNDPVAMVIFYLALICFLYNKWTTGCILFSFAVSVKMNVLLFAPGLAVLLLNRFGIVGTVLNVAVCAVIQLVLGLPFLLENPAGYIIRSFNLGRQFFYIWTVNWRCIPEWLFLSRWFHVALLLIHISLLVFFMVKCWPQPKNGWMSLLLSPKQQQATSLTSNDIIYVLFSSNFIGMLCARSLHYQFYVWYFYTLPFLLWCIRLPDTMRLLILGVIELCWNTYPSTVLSSSMLHVAHLAILMGLIFRGDFSRITNKDKSK